MPAFVDRTVSPAGLDLQERVVEINRVAKVVKGGRRFSFTALVVVGDEQSVVGIGYGKANEVPIAIQKGVERAKKNLYRVPSTARRSRTGARRLRLRPASCSSRPRPVPASSPAAASAPCSSSPGIHDILEQVAGTQNPINLVKATLAGLQDLRTPEEVAEIRGLSIAEVLGLSTEDAGAAETLEGGREAGRGRGRAAPRPRRRGAEAEAAPEETPA